MKKKYVSLLLSVALLVSLLAGCGIRVSLEEQQPHVQLDLEGLSSGDLDLQIGDQKLSIDISSLLPQYKLDSAQSVLHIPPFSGEPYIAVNGNVPYFTEDELADYSYEYYSELDGLGRCGVTMASIGRDLMPKGKRESIREIHPTGWHSVQYEFVDGKSLYNRCHLIGFQLAGENANEKNLITGTRSMNIHGMLPFENMVADYVKETGNHVMYRVTPLFHENDLVAQGVLMEGLSVEDQGQGVCFCIYAYNAEPGVAIDYGTGDNWPVEAATAIPEEEESQVYILNTASKKFHRVYCAGVENISAKNKEVYRGPREDLIKKGYTPCGGCTP